ncbi:hypothetical protein AAHA92_09911 [Salvia divinorum]|uniref:No apical meristem-associated C-terminal domain-containing protein n=1 Tax=Salvia divinorum TaxID=28513 RepID=A0ABD1HSY1_SALDI
MEPSSSPPKQTPAPQPRKKGKAKGKAKAVETSTPAPEDDKRRQNYSLEESMLLARCWIDISEDPIYSNNQKVVKYWGHIAERYNSLRTVGSKKRSDEQLRKHWDRMKREISKFSAEYTNSVRMWGSGESMEDIRDKAMKAYAQRWGEFKHYEIWLIVKDLPKFQAGVVMASGPKRTKINTDGSYTSSDGGDAVNLNEEPINEPTDESCGTPVSTDRRRPIGIKAAKRKGKAKATMSEPEVVTPIPQDPQLTSLVRVAAQRALVDTHNALVASQNPAEREYLQGLIEQLKGQLGLK